MTETPASWICTHGKFATPAVARELFADSLAVPRDELKAYSNHSLQRTFLNGPWGVRRGHQPTASLIDPIDARKNLVHNLPGGDSRDILFFSLLTSRPSLPRRCRISNHMHAAMSSDTGS